MPGRQLDLTRIDTNLLVACDVLLRERSVTRAAERLFVTQPAMSQTLNRLRDLLEDPLLVRQGGGMVLTPHAQQLAAPLAKALVELQAAIERRPSFDPATATHRFTIATTDYVGSVLLPPLIGAARREAPGINLDIRPIDVAHYGKALEQGEYDLALSVLDDEPGCAREPVLTDSYACLVRRGHPLTRKNDVTRFSEYPQVVMSPRGGGRGVVDEALTKQNLVRRVAVRVPFFSLGATMLRSTDLVMTVPCRLARLYADAYSLKTLAVPLQLPELEISQAWHRRNDADAASVWLRTAVRAIAEAQRGRGRR